MEGRGDKKLKIILAMRFLTVTLNPSDFNSMRVRI